MEKLERYLRFIREAERLKDVLRTAHTSTGRHESTAEHSWRLALLAAVLTGERPRLDMQRVLLMCLVHDLGEAYDGDIPAVAQMADGTKEASELVAIDKLTRMLPPAAGTAIRKIWEEYEACQTPEARWVKALDKAETILQHNQGANPADFDYEFNLTYGAEWFRDDALLRRLRRLLDAETARRIVRGGAMALAEGANMPSTPAAIEVLRDAYRSASDAGYPYLMLSCRLWMGNCYSDLGRMEEMLTHYSVAERLAEALRDTGSLSALRYNVASTQLELGQPEKALPYFASLPRPGFLDLHKLAICHEQLGHREQALAAVWQAEPMASGEMEQRMLALVRYRLEHPDYLHDDTYGTQLLDCFQRLRDTYPMGFTRFHLPWVLAWYKANRQYRQACRLLEEFPVK